MDDRELELNFPALKSCLEALRHLFVDISRIKSEPAYEEKRGGFGDVQVSTLDPETPMSKLVAAKTIRLRTQIQDHKRLAFRLARELKVWAGLEHPHVLPLLGFYIDEEYKTAVLLSEYMVYGDLKDYIAQQKPPWEIRLHLIRDLTDGLAYLHRQSPPIRHGDLKMGNVLVNAERRATLADFGLSKALEEGPTGLTTSEGLKGTIRYFSPELVLDKDAGDSLPSDIWAWACLVLEVLTERMAYAEKRTEFSIILALMSNELPINVESLDIPAPAVKQLLPKCWAKVPEERPSADDCLGILDAEISTLPVNADASPSTSLGAPSSLSSSLATLRDPLDHCVKCDGCAENIVGLRYQCANCPSFPVAYNLCAKCEKDSFTVHAFLHVFLKFNRRVDRPVRNSNPLLPVIYERSIWGSATEPIGNDADYVHQIALCDFCVEKIRGVWYRCGHCHADLCDFHAQNHDQDHVFIVIKAKASFATLQEVWDLNDAFKNPPLLQPVFYQRSGP